MAWQQAGSAAIALVARLPPIPYPWSVDELCGRLAAERQRDLILHPLSIPALPFGLWYDDGERDHVIYRSGLTGYHRDHVILHEVCHLLSRHGSPEQASPVPDAPSKTAISTLIDHAMRNHQVDAQEELAEMFASKVLKIARQPGPGSVSDFEQRATAMFGIAG